MSGVKTSETLLGDFRTDTRMLALAGLALPIGIISALVAKALLRLIAVITKRGFRASNVSSVASAAKSMCPTQWPNGFA